MPQAHNLVAVATELEKLRGELKEANDFLGKIAARKNKEVADAYAARKKLADHATRIIKEADDLCSEEVRIAEEKERGLRQKQHEIISDLNLRIAGVSHTLDLHTKASATGGARLVGPCTTATSGMDRAYLDALKGLYGNVT